MAKGTTPKRATRASARNKGGHESWMDDEVDEHHRSRDKISLDPDADSDDDDDAFDEGAGVMDIEADDDSDEDDDSDDEEDDEDEDDEDDEEDDEDDADVPAGDDSDDGEEEAALIKAMRAQQRRLDARGATRRTADDDDLDASASDSDDEAAGIRGSKKDDFYGDDDVDHEGQSDEEERADEEREARRLQRAAADGMDAGDFDAFSDESDEDDDASDSERETLGAKARALANQGAEKKKEKKGKKSAKNEGAAVESLGRDAVAAAASDAVASDAPELIALTKELTKTLDEITQSVEPVIAAARAGELATAEGISYLDAKHLLMLSYCINIVFYLLLKSEGRSVRDHPVVLRLVEIRAYLEKLRPIDKKLKYQIDKLLKMADGPRNEKGLGEGEDEDEDDPLRFKPNPDALVGKTDEEEGVNAGGAYRPPKMVPTAMDDFEEGGKSAKQKRKEKEARRRASRSALIKVRRMTTFPPTNIPRLVFGLGFFLPLNFLGLRRAFVGAPLHGDRRRPFLVAHSARTKSWAGYRPPRCGRLSNQELDSLSFSFSFRRRRKRRRFAHRSPRHLPRRLASVTKT
jgi:U3 small nucleolar RNA-associated protein 3